MEMLMETLTMIRKAKLMPQPSSSELVRLAQQGDEDAVGALYDLHCQAVFRYFQARLGHQQIAEDLTGDVFRRMLTSLPGYRGIDLPFRAWLFRIAHNLLVDHYRWECAHTTVSLKETKDVSGEDEDPDSVVEQKLTMEHAFQALSDLEPSQHDALALRFLSGLSLRETAFAMGKTEDAIKALQRRGLAALRLSLEMQEVKVTHGNVG
jgi:RNA polymerase sigma-70 factor (ECF subfamily)